VTLGLVTTFTVRRRGVAELRPIATRTFTAGWRQRTELPLPRGWRSARVTLRYDDGFDRGETELIVRPRERSPAAPFFEVKAEADRLLFTMK
jgi:hypothetical protein